MVQLVGPKCKRNIVRLVSFALKSQEQTKTINVSTRTTPIYSVKYCSLAQRRLSHTHNDEETIQAET